MKEMIYLCEYLKDIQEAVRKAVGPIDNKPDLVI